MAYSPSAGLLDRRIPARLGHHRGHDLFSAKHPAVVRPAAPGITRTLVLAAAVTGVGEVVLYRLAGPVASHAVDTSTSPIAAVLERGASVTLGATALLAVACALAVSVALWSIARGLALITVALVAATISAAVFAGPLGVAHAVTIASAVAVAVWTAVHRDRPLAVGVAAAAVGVAAAQWPLLIDSMGAAPAGVVAARTIAEAAVLAVPPMLAVAVLNRGTPRRAAWLAAGAAGGVAAALLAFNPHYSAMASLWTLGVTLSLPPFAYVVSAACLGLVAATWLGEHAMRTAAAGLALLAVSGIGPSAVHHNLIAVVGLMLVAGIPAVAGSSPDPADDQMEV